MKHTTLLTAVVLAAATSATGEVLSSIPGPDAQGGMIMPMVMIINSDNPAEPTTGELAISFSPSAVPVLKPLSEWSPGGWFAEGALWREDLSPPVGVGSTPPANAGSGALFNSQYGFTWMANPMMEMAFVPTGKALGIRLVSRSSEDIAIFNHGSGTLWDPILTEIGSQVLWSGNMWHPVFTVSSGAAVGTYTVEFEIFIADTTFTSGTGWVDYSLSALAANENPNFATATVVFEFAVIPEPETFAAAAGLLMLLLAIGLRRYRSERRK